MKLYTALSVILSKNFQASSLAFTAGATASNTFVRSFETAPSCIGAANSRRGDSSLHLFPMASSSNGVCTATKAARGGASAVVALNHAVQATAEKTTVTPVENFRKDYTPPSNFVTSVEMDFNIRDGKTTVTSLLTVSTNPNALQHQNRDLVLDGDETSVSLLHLSINEKDLVEGIDYEIFPGKLVIKASTLTRPSCVVKTVVEIIPEENTQLQGLYKSGSAYCTQCEAMGFRRITYYPDRPDNMATFQRVRIEADKASYPVLLSNGNLIETGEVNEGGEGRHYSVWQDPFPKPSYLFCVVAGNLGSIHDTYITSSGRKVQLEIFGEFDNVKKLDYAMTSLKKSMKWDEDTFGLEYDLDVYNIVAVADFNMGAMENKGLNVFNNALVLADPDSATDQDYERVEGVIGHEYFHNWTGNRVTCRDWFQLTLKEGLTVFRDQEFSGDMGSKAVKRIETVKGLRGRQFAEDAGPMSHPVRPESYISMDNFYTATVYSKGSEVIRMYNTLLTPAGFRKGMDLYFKRHDGSAVTCDDFRAAMADANGFDLEQFSLWYSTPGTPTVTYSYSYDAKAGKFILTLTQKSKSAEPLHIPISTGLIEKATGKEVVPTTVLNLKQESQTFTFDGLNGDVVPSILRDFSAPIKLLPASGKEDESLFAFLAAHDTDGFNKWESGQKLYTSFIFKTMRGEQIDQAEAFVYEAFGRTLADETVTDYSIKAYALALPSESGLFEELDVIDPTAVRVARKKVKKMIARKFQRDIRAMYDHLTSDMEADNGEFKVDAVARGRRALRNVLLDYLCSISDTAEEQNAAADLALGHYNSASGLTDKMAAFQCLASMSGVAATARDEVIDKFYEFAKGNALAVDKWFMTQAIADLPDVLDRVKALASHPDFTMKNPNRFRSLISVFTMNSAPFHQETGEGYLFIGQKIAEVDKLNPQLSSRLASSLIQWRRYDSNRASLMKAELQKLATMKPISDDLFEIVTKGLK